MILTTSSLPVPLAGRGKVRDIYQPNDRTLLIITTDRISAFDYVLPTGIPDKGKVLTQLSLFWLDKLRPFTKNHLISADVAEYPAELRQYAEEIAGRSMLVHRAEMIDVECVARGYLSGSGWREYRQTGTVCGIRLPAGLKESSRLPEPIFTPATKAQSGHDENISFDQMAAISGSDVAERLRQLTLTLYREAAAYAETRGILIADTKFEFGLTNGELVLCDEVLTPDSSRFWPASSYEPGRAQVSYDKQYVRDYLEQIGWNKQPPTPELPEEVTARTAEKYREAYRVLTGREL